MINAQPLPIISPLVKPQRPKDRRVMTIAAGVMCPDGIVLAADSQETVGESLKVYKPKLIELPLISSDLKVVVVGSGIGPFIDVLMERISEQLDLVNPYLASARQAIQAAINQVCDNIWPHYSTQADKPHARLIIGVRAVDGLVMLDAFVPMVKTADRYAFIGWGGDLATYKAKQLALAGMPTVVVAPLTAYILEVVKENVEFCGGDTHLAVISSSGTVEHKSQEYILNAAKGYKNVSWGLETFLFPLLATGVMPDGKNLLAAIAELGKPDVDIEKKIAEAIVTLVDTRKKALDQGIQGLPENEKAVLALASNPLPISLGMVNNSEMQLYERGVIPVEVHEEFQRLYLKAVELVKQANEALNLGDLVTAKNLLLSMISLLSASTPPRQIVGQLPEGQP